MCAPGSPTRSTCATRVRTLPKASTRSSAAMRAEHGLGLVDARGLALAIPQAAARAAALADEHPAVAATDAAVIEALVVPRLADASWQYRHDAHGVAALVDKGAATAAILCSPVSVAATRAAADRPRAHAAEDDVLLAQAPHGHGVPHPRLSIEGAGRSAPVTRRSRSGPERSKRVEVAGARTLDRLRRAAVASTRRTRPGRRRGTRRREWAFRGARPSATARTRATGSGRVSSCTTSLSTPTSATSTIFASPNSLITTPCSPSAPKRTGSPCFRSMSMSGRASLLRIVSNAPSLKTLQFWYTSTNGGALVLVRTAEGLRHVLAVHVVGAGHEARLGAQRDRDRVERVVERTERRRLGDLADLARRRVLALGEAVDLVVEHQDLEVHVAAQRVDEVVATDRQHVAVATDDPHVEVGSRQRDTRCDRGRAPVDAVHAVRVHVVRQPRRAADARHEHEVLGPHARSRAAGAGSR